MPNIFDTHCHYNLEPLWPNWADHWAKAQQAGVAKSMVVGTDLESSRVAIELATAETQLYAAVGLHPTDITSSSVSDLSATLSTLEALAASPAVIAIGETGLDYFRLRDDERDVIIEHQKHLFRAQIQLANRLELPLLIHARDRQEQAYWDILAELKQQYQAKRPFVLHCVSGPLDYIQAAVEMGGYIGIAGNVTYKNADHIRSIVRTTPPDRLLLETDAPFLPPQEFRGQVCQPWMIKLTAEYLEELGIELEGVWENSLRFFFPS